MALNNKQRKTLENVFHDPVLKNIPFSDLDALCVALGCEIKNRGGSMFAYLFPDGQIWHDHRPHSPNIAKAHHIKTLRSKLIKLGVKP
jgi:hypothetical protein